MLAVKRISLLAFTAAKQGLVYAKGYGGYVGVKVFYCSALTINSKSTKVSKTVLMVGGS